MICSLKNSLGTPKEGVHAARMIGDLATNDVLPTFVAPLLVTLFVWCSTKDAIMKQYPVRFFVLLTAWLVLTGILLHRLFCVRSTVDILIFPGEG